MRDRSAREHFERRVVVDFVSVQDPAVAVRGVLAQADVGQQQQLRKAAAQLAQGALPDTVLGPRAGPFVVLLVGDAEENDRLHAEAHELFHFARDVVDTEAAEWRQQLVLRPGAPRAQRTHAMTTSET